MGWFDEQIRARKQKDQEAFEDSVIELAGVVLGRKKSVDLDNERLVTEAAIKQILKYFRCKAKELPQNVRDTDEELECLLRPHGIMRRNIILERGWYRDAFGPILAFRKNDNVALALIPRGLTGYYYRDPETGKRVNIGRKNAEEIEAEAICFYRPMPLRKLTAADLFAYMADCIRPGDYALIILASLAITLLGLLIPVLTNALTGRVVESGNYTVLLGIAVFMSCTMVSSLLLGTVQNLTVKRIEIKASVSVEAAAMMRIMTLPAKFFRKYSSGEMCTRLQSINALCTIIFGSVVLGGITAVMSLLYILEIGLFSQALLLPAMTVITLSMLLMIAVSVLKMNLEKKRMKYSAKESGMIYALITGMQKIRLAGAEKRAFARWAKLYAKSARCLYDPPIPVRIYSVFSLAITLIGNIVLYYIAVKSGITVPEYMAFSAAFGSVFSAFASLAQIIMTMVRIPTILEMAQPILDAEPEVSENKEVITRLSGSIELNNVSFRYEDNSPPIIDGLSLKIRSGEYVAIVGRTGCGKSTLLRILLGFEKPERGAVYYDGRDLERIDLKSLRLRIGVVMQDSGLFQGDIYSNIVISAPWLTVEQAWEAAEAAGIADDIRAMPMGMQTIISEGQGGISGGQKQRIMIARAIAPKPKILMFDEATSALDNKTQRQVSEALDGLRCTRIVIAHRLSTIKNCSRILYLENGKIAEDGTYEELIALNGKFAELVKDQRMDK